MKPPSAGDWEHVIRNAQRVRVFNPDYENGLSSETLWMLRLHSPVQHLFPRINTLSFGLYGEDYHKILIHLLIGPMLERVSISGAGGKELSTLMQIQNTSDRLREFAFIGTRPAGLTITEGLSGLFTRFSNSLQVLSLLSYTMTPGVFRIAACMPSLKAFHFGVEGGHNVFQVIKSVPIPFPALRSVELHGRNLRSSSAAAFLQMVKTSSLEVFSLTVKEHPSREELKPFFELVASHHVLEEFGLRCITRFDTVAGYSIDFEILQPLLKLPLSHLSIFRIPVRLKAGDILKVARALPRIQALFLEPNQDQTSPDPPKLQELVHFAEHCPLLKILDIWVDATDVTIGRTRPGNGHVALALRAFSPGESPIAGPKAVAAFLSDIFPFATLGPYATQMGDDEDDVDGGEITDTWKSVSSLLNVFADIRFQERLHYRNAIRV